MQNYYHNGSHTSSIDVKGIKMNVSRSFLQPQMIPQLFSPRHAQLGFHVQLDQDQNLVIKNEFLYRGNLFTLLDYLQVENPFYQDDKVKIVKREQFENSIPVRSLNQTETEQTSIENFKNLSFETKGCLMKLNYRSQVQKTDEKFTNLMILDSVYPRQSGFLVSYKIQIGSQEILLEYIVDLVSFFKDQQIEQTPVIKIFELNNTNNKVEERNDIVVELHNQSPEDMKVEVMSTPIKIRKASHDDHYEIELGQNSTQVTTNENEEKKRSRKKSREDDNYSFNMSEQITEDEDYSSADISRLTSIDKKTPKRYRNISVGTVKQGSQQKGDKKNVVKNYVKAFRNFICEWGPVDEIMQVLGIANQDSLVQFRKKLQLLEKKRHYNNRFIVELLQNKEIKGIFAHFLQRHAEKWLMESGVVDKKAHLEVLKTYIEASLDEKNIEKIVCLRPRASAKTC